MPRKIGLNLPVIITDRPNAVISLRFSLVYVRCYSCFHLNTYKIFSLVKASELPLILERAATSAFRL